MSIMIRVDVGLRPIARLEVIRRHPLTPMEMRRGLADYEVFRDNRSIGWIRDFNRAGGAMDLAQRAIVLADMTETQKGSRTT
jgi:hypothetical protein